MIKLENKTPTLKKWIKTQENLCEPFRPGQRSQTCNPLNLGLRLN
jgi:hypothetical protein